MKKFLTLFLSLAILANTFAAVSVEAPPRKASEIMVPIGAAGQMISLSDLSRMKVKQFQALTGKKMSLKEKVAFKLAQVKMKAELKQYEATGNFKPVDFKDPVQKWFWFWIFGWGLAIVLSFTPLWFVAWAFGLFGTISLIIWLVKKFGGA